MPHAFAAITFTDAVKNAQVMDGSRASYARAFESGGGLDNHLLGTLESKFIESQRSVYVATVSETGWPYVQHRGGPPGFLRVTDPETLVFADFSGNRQFITLGNLVGNARAAMILVDYRRRMRLKLLGLLRSSDSAADLEMVQQLSPMYPARPRRAMIMQIAAFDWNCPQHIPVRFEEEDVKDQLAERDARIADLESRLRT